MLTQCPNCETTFRVTSEILRVAQGQVRCGRCQTQFDALQRLIDERAPEPVRQSPAASPPDPNAGIDSSSIEVEEPETHEEITMEGNRIEISGTYRVLDADSTDGEPQLRQEVVEEWMEVDDDDAPIPEGYVDVSGEYDATGAFDSTGAFESTGTFDDLRDSRERPGHDFEKLEPTNSIDAANAVRAFRTSAATRDALLQGASATTLEDEDNLDSLNVHQRRRPAALIWKLAALPLLLLFIAQVIHHYRAQLARHPRLGAPIMAIYRALHLNLTPGWELHAYEIRQWGVVTDTTSPGALKVRASITNRAGFPQPFPLLRLVLEDRWGEQVRARDFEPADYLDPGVASDRMVAPGQQANATIVIVDPGPDAEGFRFDVCLHGEAGTVCAADIPGAQR